MMAGPYIVICFSRGRVVSATFHPTQTSADRRVAIARSESLSRVEIKAYDLAKMIELIEVDAEQAEARQIEELERMMR